MFKGSVVKFNFIKRSGIIPYAGLNIQRHMKPDKTVGTAQHTIIADLNIVEPFLILFKHEASIIDVETVKAVEPIQNVIVLTKVGRNKRSRTTYS